MLEEGGDGDGDAIRKEKDVPPEAGARKKWFLQEENRQSWTFDAGRLYQADFFNPYLDFNSTSARRSCAGPTLTETARLRAQTAGLLPQPDGILGWTAVEVGDSPPQTSVQSRYVQLTRVVLIRYVLKNRQSKDVYFVIVFSLLLTDDVEREEAEVSGDKDAVEGKPEAERVEPSGDDDVD